MRPQLTWRAGRAAPAGCALALTAGITGPIATSTAAPPPHGRHPASHEPRSAQPARVRAYLLHRNLLIGQDVPYVGHTSPAGQRRTIVVQLLERARWVAVAPAVSDRRGLFHARIWPQRLGRLRPP